MHRRLAVRGQVQVGGFRPWVWRQASALGVVGWVRDAGAGVEIDLHGDAPLLDALQERLWQAPHPARIELVEVVALAPGGDASTRQPKAPAPSEIQASVDGTQARAAVVGTDLAVCHRCLADVFTPGNRRWRHPFANCPHCGPRYTITRNLPFDRAHTSMARFQTCPACEAECEDSQDRRYHHQTNACPACGPRLWLRMADGTMDAQEPIAAALRLLREGGILALKSTGGFHLCCDAGSPATVARLRHRKHRDVQPLAVMAANVASLRHLAEIDAHAPYWLQSAERPIVLLRQTAAGTKKLAHLTPGLNTLGAMLPHTPIQYLLFHEAAGRPTHDQWLQEANPLLLAVTSGNAPGSPMVIENDTALRELAEMADAWLMHDRDILARSDDSVLRVRPDGSACFLRRGRGHEPAPTSLPAVAPGPVPSVLALGGLHRATVCVTQGERALVSPHVGDLDSIDTRLTYARLADLWPGWLGTQPDALACDMNPDFFSTLLAAHLSHTRASASSGAGPLPVIAVQHHHAHIGAVLAEHPNQKDAMAPCIGLVADGMGLGSDGQAWGGELLRVEGGEAQRLGHLLPCLLPGGDAAVQEPWRMAAAALHALGRGDEIATRFARHAQAGALASGLARAPAHTLRTSSLGRLFDAAAGLLDVLHPRVAIGYEGEAAMRLACLAGEAPSAEPLPDGWRIDEELVLDWRPLMAWLADQTRRDARGGWPPPRHVAGRLAAVFHATLAEALAEWVRLAARRHGLGTVVLAGACMANALLDDALHARLEHSGLRVWRARQYPCGDGSLSLGQAWVARLRLMAGHAPWQPGEAGVPGAARQGGQAA